MREDFENQFEEDFDDEPILDFFRGLLDSLPKDKAYILDPVRFLDAKHSIEKIIAIVQEDYPDAKANLEYSGLFGTDLCFSISAKGINVYDTNKFAEAISVANTMDVTVLVDGTVELGFMFEDVRRIAVKS